MSMDETGKNYNNDELFSKAVRAGKRTYFFDVKSTRSGESYLTITESKKRFDQPTGKFFYEKHKLFLYQEDFQKFHLGLMQAFEYVKTGKIPESYLKEMEEEETRRRENDFTNLDFEDLDNERTRDTGE
jgi:hypothetical protein